MKIFLKKSVKILDKTVFLSYICNINHLKGVYTPIIKNKKLINMSNFFEIPVGDEQEFHGEEEVEQEEQPQDHYVVVSLPAHTKTEPYRRRLEVNGVKTKIYHQGIHDEAMAAFLKYYLGVKIGNEISDWRTTILRYFPKAKCKYTFKFNEKTYDYSRIVFDINLNQ